MLVQITNKCFGGCEHCMQGSNPKGKHMDFETFKKAVDLAVASKTAFLLISGGEPSDHPEFMKLVEYANERIPFCICTNGYWAFDFRREWFKEIGEMANCCGIQVYSNPRYYERHWEVYKNRALFKSIKHCALSTEPIENMQLLGRAKNSEKAIEDAKKSKYHMSCLFSTLMARQADSMEGFMDLMNKNFHFCTPMIDTKGNIHMSESCKCQSVASVDDPVALIFHKMKMSKPCGHCYGYEKFVRSKREDIEKAREILLGGNSNIVGF